MYIYKTIHDVFYNAAGDWEIQYIILFVILYIVFSVAIYVYMPFKRIIVNPTPETIKESIYLDDIGVCYKYKQDIRKCDTNIKYIENKLYTPDEKYSI